MRGLYKLLLENNKLYQASEPGNNETGNGTVAALLTYEQKVGVTLGFEAMCVYFLAFIVLNFIFHFTNIHKVGRRRQLPYVNLSILGLIIGCQDPVALIWTRELDTGGEHTNMINALWIFYCIGFPLIFIPIIMRSWRVICFYVTTVNLNCTLSTPLHQRPRRDCWMITRITLFMIPFVILYGLVFLPLLPDDTRLADYILTPLQCILITLNLALTFIHCCLRKSLQESHLSEVKSLFAFSMSLYLYFAYDNFSYYYLFDVEGAFLYAILGYLVLYNLMFWTLVIGSFYAIFKRGAQKAVEDIKKSEIQIVVADKVKATLAMTPKTPRARSPSTAKETKPHHIRGVSNVSNISGLSGVELLSPADENMSVHSQASELGKESPPQHQQQMSTLSDTSLIAEVTPENSSPETNKQEITTAENSV